MNFFKNTAQRIVLILLMLVQGWANAELLLEIPKEFTVSKRWYSFTSDFDITDDKNINLGYVHRKYYSPVMRYDLYDAAGDLQATAKMHFYAWGALVLVHDVDNNHLGTTEIRKVKYDVIFDIINAAGETQIIAEPDFWGTNFKLTDPQTEILMGNFFKKSWVAIWSTQTVWKMQLIVPDVFYGKVIDPRLFIITMGVQSDIDEWWGKLPAHKPHEPNDNPLKKSVCHDSDYTKQQNQFHDVTEADFKSVEALFEELYTNAAAQIQSKDDKVRMGYAIAASLLEGDTLTPGQKKALRFLLRERRCFISR